MPREHDLSTAEGIRDARIQFRAEKIIDEMPDPASARMVQRLLAALMDDVHGRAVDLIRDDAKYGDEPPVWCETCEHIHIPAIPVRTFQCTEESKCGFGVWTHRLAQQHANEYRDHHVIPVIHRVRPLNDEERLAWLVERAATLQDPTIEPGPPPSPKVADVFRKMQGDDE